MKVTDIELFFTAADTNHNGKLTQKEMKKALVQNTVPRLKYMFLYAENSVFPSFPCLGKCTVGITEN